MRIVRFVLVLSGRILLSVFGSIAFAALTTAFALLGQAEWAKTVLETLKEFMR